MTSRPAWLYLAAAASWAAAIACDAANASDRIYRPLFSVAITATVITSVHAMLSHHARSNAAVTRAVLTRPFNRDCDTGPIARIMDTGPMRKLTGVSPQHAGETGPLARVSVLRRPHGQHASRRSADA